MIQKLVILLVIISFYGCQKEDNAGEAEAFRLPAHFPEPVYDFSRNPFTKEGFELGRKLFYDPILSLDSTVSCGTCHAQVHAFADHNTAFSAGIDGRLGARNAPPIFNLMWKKHFMWDGGINHIEVMPVAPITDKNEMGESLKEVISKLSGHKEYPVLFKKVFGKEKIDDRQLLLALAQFQGRIISATSRYDLYLQGKASFSEDEKKGFEIFKEKCAACHTPPLFTDQSFRNTGLDFHSKDPGRARITLLDTDHGKFAVPSLRNIALTYPYMHDGRFRSLDEVLDFYISGVKDNPNLDPMLKNEQTLKTGISITHEEKQMLIKFLHTLTDHTMLSNHLYAEQ